MRSSQSCIKLEDTSRGLKAEFTADNMQPSLEKSLIKATSRHMLFPSPIISYLITTMTHPTYIHTHSIHPALYQAVINATTKQYNANAYANATCQYKSGSRKPAPRKGEKKERYGIPIKPPKRANLKNSNLSNAILSQISPRTALAPCYRLWRILCWRLSFYR